MGSPSAELTAPTSSDPIPDLVENIVGFPQYISPSYWLGWAAEQVCGTNPWQWVADQYAGDWAAVQKAGVAVKNLAEFNTAYAGSINSAVATVKYDWQGNAADSAAEYFNGLVKVLQDQVSSLNSLGGQFNSMAIGMYESANAIKGLLETLTDLLIAIGIEAAAAAASSWTVIGPILAGAAAAVTVTKAIGVWGQAIEVHNHVWTAVQGFTGVVAGLLGGLQGLDAQPLPAGAYDHAGV
ncbi:hypothetical protein I0C86_17520 [Plantactinospora sp. S1510]|uniref:Uncharacterized protein n=1 Tax=Plantactinospora alkalitolerans TaxID=2789879 RepID=A0ABS0GX08_9ACTN|nr:hypothetical protein [Plantactinospora alkalitolerans]MBF9130744.1 hypothetical protein [Plantactinospora alkalitolerans]